MTWLNLVLDVPAALAQRSTAFWSAVTGWTPETGAEDTVALLPAAGDHWLKVRASGDVSRASVAVEVLGAVGDARTIREGHPGSPNR